MGKKLIGLFEILTLIIASFSFAFIVNETNNYFQETDFVKESKSVSYLREKLINWIGKSLVSAQANPTVLWTCVQNVNGTICQEYPNTICSSVCTSNCLQTTIENTAPCQIGTCYNTQTGICSDGSPKFACENSGGQWSAQPLVQCNRNCCLINPDGQGGGAQAQYTTQQQCNYLSQTLGASTSWVPVNNEIECLVRANSQAEGACVLEFIEAEQKYNCEFKTQGSCYASGGDFYQGRLCTDQALNTICETTVNGDFQTFCYEDKDEVYFVDSCGNRANIYDSTKINDANYWSFVLPKSQSCNLGSSANQFSNQDSCGSCNYIGGSICGTPVSGKDDEPIYGNYVCRDLRCTDYRGNIRQNGESWCRFDSRIGVDGNDGGSDERSVDVPGSRHYKQSCFNGEVRLEPCQDYRNEICIESEGTSGYTSANCRINLWQQCIAANENKNTLDKCEERTDCFLKHVEVDEYFEFDVCAPKYPPGFDSTINNGAQVGESICSAASQTCTYVEQKGFDGWSCVANCECRTSEFSEQMNNLCISLGDCGGYINLAGKYTDDGYSISEEGKKVSQGYINRLQQYKTPVQGQRVEPLSPEEVAALLGLPSVPNDPEATAAEIAGWVLGIGGLGMAASLVIAELIYGASFAAEFGIGAFAVPFSIESGSTLGGLGQWANLAAAAAVGAAIGFILAKALGLQGDAVLVVTLGGAAGGVVPYALGAELFETTFFVGIGIGIAIALILVFVLELGETRERHVEFTCMPWQPPPGGSNCDLCNSDYLGCSKYKCDSLGQNCELINEGTDEQLCIDINPNDANPPIIDKWDDAIGANYSYLNPQINVGTEIKSTINNDGCIKEYAPVEFGLVLNEPGQCKVEESHTASYNEMTELFGDSNLYKKNHSAIRVMPTLNELGVSGIDPGRRGNYNLYVRCQDTSGNSNVNEYNIRFCVRPADDITPPLINAFVPPTPGQVGFNVNTFNLQFYTNEPATCRWSSQDKTYGLMENNVLCFNEISSVVLGPSGPGWRCLTNLTVGTNSTENFYFRCADQPWLGQNSTGPVSGRNVNTQSTTYQLQKTTTPLIIHSIVPNGTTIYTGGNFAVVNLEARTSGGINNNALCDYLPGIQFFTTGGQIHKQNNLQLPAGNYLYLLMCTDSANNVATSEAIFSVEVDNIGPIITRVYDGNNVLNVITNEQSQCAYSNANCAFEFSNGTLMNGNNYVHTTSFSQGITYRIKCRDGFGNVGQCLAVSGGY